MSTWVNEQCLRRDQTREESVKAYGEMASIFNSYVDQIKYIAPKKCADLLSELFPRKDGVKVLDMACGTGLVAQAMKLQEFTHIDGVDPSSGMLEEAKGTGAYNKLICCYIGVRDEKLPLEDDFYDAVTICGGMGQNMVPCNGVHEMIRLVKPGGYIINIFREEIVTAVDEYRDRLEPLMDSLEKEGKWQRVARTPYPEYQVDKPVAKVSLVPMVMTATF